MSDILDELVNSCDEVLKECEKYEYLWDEGYIGKTLVLYGGFIAQDESFNVGVCRRSEDYLFGKFAFTGKNFGGRCDELSAGDAANLMHAWYYG